MGDPDIAHVAELIARRAQHPRLALFASIGLAAIFGSYSLGIAWTVIEHHDPALRLALESIRQRDRTEDIVNAVRLIRDIASLEATLRTTGILTVASSAWALLEWMKASSAHINRILWERIERLEARLEGLDRPQ